MLCLWLKYVLLFALEQPLQSTRRCHPKSGVRARTLDLRLLESTVILSEETTALWDPGRQAISTVTTKPRASGRPRFVLSGRSLCSRASTAFLPPSHRWNLRWGDPYKRCICRLAKSLEEMLGVCVPVEFL